MDKFKNISGKLILCVCEIAVGVVLFTEPESFTRLIVTAVGVLFCVLGVFATIRYFREDPEAAALSQELTRGLIALSLGIFLICKADWIVRSFMPITVLYGIAALLTGIVKLQWTVDMLRIRRGSWLTTGIAAVMSIVVAVIVFASPFKVRNTLWTFTAVALILIGVVDAVSAILSQMERSEKSE